MTNKDVNTNIDINMLICLGSEYDNADFIKSQQDQNKCFVIKRALCEEAVEHWLIVARSEGICQELHESKNRYVGMVSHVEPICCEKSGLLFVVFEVIEQKLKADGKEFPEVQLEVNTWWTNLAEKPETVIQLYNTYKITGRQ